jgi:hypothetical protein
VGRKLVFVNPYVGLKTISQILSLEVVLVSPLRLRKPVDNTVVC